MCQRITRYHSSNKVYVDGCLAQTPRVKEDSFIIVAIFGVGRENAEVTLVTHLVKVSRGQFVYCFAFTYTPMRLTLNAPVVE